MLYLLTSPNCGRCNITKNMLKNNNIEFQEVEVDSLLGQKIINELSLKYSGALVIDNTGSFNEISIQDALVSCRK